MNAPEVVDHQTYFPHAKLVPSKTNPRKRKGLDIASLTELAQTMRPPNGILQPILVRWVLRPPVDGIEAMELEIIAGERRWRAAGIAGLTEVPCIVRQLSDLEVLRIQLIENKQREDLDPLEEAEGYEKLMQQQDADGNNHTADTIADAMGVSKSTIYARLKLLDLCQDVREVVYKGELDPSTALLIARIPTQKLQMQALKELTEENWDGRRLSYRAAKDHLQKRYMLALKDAPFDTKDANLLQKVGACQDCAKRTGNNPDLFDDVKSKDVCTDTVCFGMKKAAHVLAIQVAAEKEGHTVIKGKASEKIITSQWNQNHDLHQAGLAKLDETCPHDGKGRSWEKVLKETKLLNPPKSSGREPIKMTLVEDPFRNENIQTVSIEQATKALREAGFEITRKGSKTNAAESKATKEAKARVEGLKSYIDRLFDALHQQVETSLTGEKAFVDPVIYLVMAQAAYERVYDDSGKARIAGKFIERSDFKNNDELVEAFTECIPSLTTQSHFMIMLDSMMNNERNVSSWEFSQNTWQPKGMEQIAAAIGIDAPGILQEAESEAKAKLAEKTKPKAKAATKAKPAAKKAEKEKIIAEGNTLKKSLTTTWPFPTAQDKKQFEDGEETPRDKLYDQAAKVVMVAQRSSISLVQRELKIGYNRAARIIEDLEKGGIVSAIKEDGSRDVLKTVEEVAEGGAA